MHPRRRNIGQDSDKNQNVANDLNYNKLDKKPSNNPFKAFAFGNQFGSPRTDEYSTNFEEDPLAIFTEEDSMSVDPVMAARDRTNELAAAIRSLQGRIIARATASQDARKAQAIHTYSQFMHSAKILSKNISSTYLKLEKLAILAKKKSLFDDRPAEIQELTYIIKGDLSSLNQQIAKLSEMPRGQRSMQNHSSSVVLALQSRLASMSSHFKQVLEVRSENLKHQSSRQQYFTRSLPPAYDSATLLQQDEVNIDLGDAPNHVGIQSQQLAMRDDTESYVQQRAETMHNIESTIVELGGIFQQLAHMVKEQDEAVGRIDANIQEADLNVEAAHGQILKYFQGVNANRALMFKIFGVLILFFLFFVVFIA